MPIEFTEEALTSYSGLELFRRFADQKVSYTDCVSFVLMRRYAIVRAFAFDRHFIQAGFDLWPGA